MSEPYNNSSIKTAVALGYDAAVDAAPRVLASGKGDIADYIIALAKENKVLIHKDKQLAALLSVLAVNAYIPLAAYSAVAEILSYLYKYNAKLKKQKGNS